MINPGPAQALAQLASRAQEMLNAYQPGYETQDDEIRSFTLARPKPENDPMSVSAPEGAYFVGVDAQGRTFFSRDGSFKLDGTNVTWGDGSYVLGYPPHAPAGSPPQRLKADPIDAALGRTAGAEVAADGSIVYHRTAVDPRTGKSTSEPIAIGTVALARFPAATALERVSATRVTMPAGIAPVTGRPGEASFGSLATKSRDVGSVDFEAGLNEMREAFLALDAMSAGAHVDDLDAHVAMDLVK
jgi:flagellar basal body rod protein FlgG